MSDTTHKQAKFTGKHMIFAMLTFFAVILTANLVMVYFAKKSWTGLVTEHSYKDNQVFDQETQKLNEMYQMGVNLIASYQDGKIRIQAIDQQKTKIQGASLDLVVGRVIHERDDQVLRLTETKAGVYEVAHPLEPGRWQLKVAMILPTGKKWDKTYLIEVNKK